MRDLSTRAVLEAVGVSGGLLGIISCVVPLVFYASYYRKKLRWFSMLCVVLPLMVIAAFIWVIYDAHPQKVSLLTILTFSLLIFMTCGAWIWAIIKSFKIAKPNDQCCKCGSKLKCCLQPYDYYPCCCPCYECNKQSSSSRVQPYP